MTLETKFLRSLYYVSSMIKADLKDTAGHNRSDGLDGEHIEDTIPNSLSLLLSLITGDNKNDECLKRILIIA